MENENNVTDGFVQLLPFVPLHKLVIFPYMNANFELSGDESITSFEGALDEGREVFLATHQVDAVRVPDYEAFNKIGVVTRIKSILRTPGGPVRVTVEGVRRARFLSIQMVKGAPMAEIQDLPRKTAQSCCSPLPQRAGGLFPTSMCRGFSQDSQRRGGLSGKGRQLR